MHLDAQAGTLLHQEIISEHTIRKSIFKIEGRAPLCSRGRHQILSAGVSRTPEMEARRGTSNSCASTSPVAVAAARVPMPRACHGASRTCSHVSHLQQTGLPFVGTEACCRDRAGRQLGTGHLQLPLRGDANRPSSGDAHGPPLGTQVPLG